MIHDRDFFSHKKIKDFVIFFQTAYGPQTNHVTKENKQRNEFQGNNSSHVICISKRIYLFIYI